MTKTQLQISSRLIAEAAERRGWAVEYVDPAYTSLVRITPPGRPGKFFKSSVTEHESFIGGYIAANKYISYVVLSSAGCPVPMTWLSSDDSFVPDTSKTYVVKPATANHGDGVHVNLRTKEAVDAAIQQASCYDKAGEVVVQEQLGGSDHRFLVVGDEVFVVKRSPPIATGDGISTVKQLVEELNRDPMRGEGREGVLNRILIEDVEAYIGSEKLASIPANGETVQLLGTSNVGRGGSTENLTETTHQSLKNLALKVARLLGTSVCGVDIMCEDSAKAVTEQACGIIEVNLSPGIRMHHRPSIGTPVNIADKILDVSFKE